MSSRVLYRKKKKVQPGKNGKKIKKNSFQLGQ
jgi:hypothetical protein